MRDRSRNNWRLLPTCVWSLVFAHPGVLDTLFTWKFAIALRVLTIERIRPVIITL